MRLSFEGVRNVHYLCLFREQETVEESCMVVHFWEEALLAVLSFSLPHSAPSPARHHKYSLPIYYDGPPRPLYPVVFFASQHPITASAPFICIPRPTSSCLLRPDQLYKKYHRDVRQQPQGRNWLPTRRTNYVVDSCPSCCSVLRLVSLPLLTEDLHRQQ